MALGQLHDLLAPGRLWHMPVPGGDKGGGRRGSADPDSAMSQRATIYSLRLGRGAENHQPWFFIMLGEDFVR